MLKLLQLLQKHLSLFIPLFMVLGFLFGSFFDAGFLKAWILPITFFMVYPMMVNFQIQEIFKKMDIKLQLSTQLINFIILPALALGLGYLLLPNSPEYRIGLLLMALIPTSGMTISWTGFSKGNIQEAVKMTVIGLILGALLSPLYLTFLAGASVDVPVWTIMRQILIVVFLPMIIGYITRIILIKRFGEKKYKEDLKQVFPPFSTLGVFAIVFAAVALKAQAILNNPEELLVLLLPLVLFYIFAYGISTVAGKVFFTRENAIALVFGTAMRNLSIALAIAVTAFGNAGSSMALIIALAYILQVQTAALYVKFSQKIL
jgi:ACR3 family arsenite transporter